MSTVSYETAISVASRGATESNTVACGSGAERMHIALCFFEDTNGGAIVSGVTLDGDAMTPIGGTFPVMGTNGSTDPGLEAFYLAAGAGVREGSLELIASYAETGKDAAVIFALCETISGIEASASCATTSTAGTSRFYSDGACNSAAYTLVDSANRVIGFHVVDNIDSAISSAVPAIVSQGDVGASNGFEWCVGDSAPGATIDFGENHTTGSRKKAIGLIELTEGSGAVVVPYVKPHAQRIVRHSGRYV